MTTAEVTAGSSTLSNSTTMANAGPNVWSTAANWSGGAVPVDDDDIYIEDSSVSIYYGLDQSAITADSLTIKQSFLGTIGLPRTNSSGYVEYRDTYLKISPDVTTIGGGEGIGSGRIKLNFGLVKSLVTILDSGDNLEDGIPSILLLGTHADNTLDITKGSAGVAFYAGEVSTLLTLKLGYDDSQETDAEVKCGKGVMLGTVTKNGGTLSCDTTTAAITAITQTAGELEILGKTNAVTLLNLYGGTCYYATSGTCTTVNVSGGAILDFHKDTRGKTVTNCTIHSGAAILDPQAVVTWTNGIDLSACGLEDCSLQIGKHRTWTPTAI